jgi:hypothetical protein
MDQALMLIYQVNESFFFASHTTEDTFIDVSKVGKDNYTIKSDYPPERKAVTGGKDDF